MPEHSTTWCYVQDPETCMKYPKATVTPGQRWRQCSADGSDSNPSDSNIESNPPSSESSNPAMSLEAPKVDEASNAPAASGSQNGPTVATVPSSSATNGSNDPILLQAQTGHGKANVQIPADIIKAHAGGGPPQAFAPPQPAAAAIVFHPPQPIKSSEFSMA